MTVRNFPALGRARVIGILNVTPDSFSDGGRFDSADSAVRAGLQMLNEGADVLDVGGESTRPGAARVTEADERARVLPVISGLVAAGARVSVDTARASVAEAALDAGAVLVNDVSGGTDPAMFPLVAERGIPYVLMHSRGPSSDMTARAVYRDLVREVTVELGARLDAAAAAGIVEDQLVLDPGVGFAKTADHNWTLLAMLDRLYALGRPLLLGTSRKSFLGALLADVDGVPRAVDERDDATQATTALVAAAGVWGVRVHAVRPAADAVRVAAALLDARRAAGRESR
jgi:dihydropteroate synthase